MNVIHEVTRNSLPELPSAVGDLEKCLSQISTTPPDELIEDIVTIAQKQLRYMTGEELLFILSSVYILSLTSSHGSLLFFEAVELVTTALEEQEVILPCESLYKTVSWIESLKNSRVHELVHHCQQLKRRCFQKTAPTTVLHSDKYQQRNVLFYWLSQLVQIKTEAQLVSNFTALCFRKNQQTTAEISSLTSLMSTFQIQGQSLEETTILWKAFVDTRNSRFLKAIALLLPHRKTPLKVTTEDARKFYSFLAFNHSATKEELLCVLPALLTESTIEIELRHSICSLILSRSELLFQELHRLFSTIVQMKSDVESFLRILFFTKWRLGNSVELFKEKNSSGGLKDTDFTDLLLSLEALVEHLPNKQLHQETIRHHFIQAIIGEIVWIVRDAKERLTPRTQMHILFVKQLLVKAAATTLSRIQDDAVRQNTSLLMEVLRDESTRLTDNTNENSCKET